jgi:hypothetical protein
MPQYLQACSGKSRFAYSCPSSSPVSSKLKSFKPVVKEVSEAVAAAWLLDLLPFEAPAVVATASSKDATNSESLATNSVASEIDVARSDALFQTKGCAG